MTETNSTTAARPEEVTLTNVSRRPLLMRLPGKSLRLSPGDQQVVARSLLATAELLHMCEQGLVAVSSLPEAVPEVALAARDEAISVAEMTSDGAVPELRAAVETAHSEHAEPAAAKSEEPPVISVRPLKQSDAKKPNDSKKQS